MKEVMQTEVYTNWDATNDSGAKFGNTHAAFPLEQCAENWLEGDTDACTGHIAAGDTQAASQPEHCAGSTEVDYRSIHWS